MGKKYLKSWGFFFLINYKEKEISQTSPTKVPYGFEHEATRLQVKIL